MKNLTLALIMLISIAAKSQTKVITNADGSSATVTRNGNTVIVSTSNGKQFTAVNNGFSSVIMDGSGHLQMTRNGNTMTMSSSNGQIYTWIDSRNSVELIGSKGSNSSYQRNVAPFVLSIMDRHFFVTFYKDSYTIEHLDGSYLVTTVSGDKITTDVAIDIEPPAPVAVVAPVNVAIPVRSTSAIKSKMFNADGTYTTIIKNGNTYKVSTEYTVTMDGDKATITNPDGTIIKTNDDKLLLLPSKKATKAKQHKQAKINHNKAKKR